MGVTTKVEKTRFQVLRDIWQGLMPQRELVLSGDDIRVRLPGSDDAYSATEMSDGERSVFYLVGQALMADPHSLLIFDEPELHVHRSISSKLWDAIVAARPDCAFIIITHDLEFAATRTATKYVIRDYSPTNNWSIDPVPDDSGFDEDTTTAILGSRRPILFVEGTLSSIDFALYRTCYPEWTVIPRGSCEAVIHAVTTMRANSAFTRVTCAGIIDADNRSEKEVQELKASAIHALPVSEIENLIASPTVTRAIAEYDGHRGNDLERLLDKVASSIFNLLENPENKQLNEAELNRAIVLHCKRRVDRALKFIDLGRATTATELQQSFTTRTREIDISAIAQSIRDKLCAAVKDRDLVQLLALYSNKGIVSEVARELRGSRKDTLIQWLLRMLSQNQAPGVTMAFKDLLPELEVV